MTHEEFVAQAISSNSGYICRPGFGIREAGAIIERMQADRRGRSPRQYLKAIRNRRIASWARSDFAHNFPVEVWTLSPSDAEFELFLAELGRRTAVVPSPTGRMPTLRPNACSVVSWIRIGPIAILLGADLEESSRPGCGWASIVDDSMRPTGKADVFKIPHHGSVTAHNDRVWTELIHQLPHAILTPYNRGRTSLPTDTDVARISGLTDKAVLTARFASGRVRRRHSAVERTLREMGARLTPIATRPGRVTYRVRPRSAPLVWT